MKEENENMFICEKIQDVWYEELEFENTVWVHFRYGNCQYEINLRRGVAQHYNVYHEREVDKLLCPFCADRKNRCGVLSRRSKEIFDYLLKHPTIRLRWLFHPKNNVEE